MIYRVITGTLEARTSVHLGNGHGNGLTDAQLRRDAEGQPFLPGTALAGALRTLLTRLAPRFGLNVCEALTGSTQSCNCAVCQLLGDVNPSDEKDARSAASRLLVFNARPAGVQPRPLVRDGVGIDRVADVAARAGAVKFDLEVLPTGARFELRMELRNSSIEDEQLLAAGLAEWQAGRLWLGGRVARGLGAFQLLDLEYKTIGLETPEQVLGFLRTDTPWQELATLQAGWLEKQVSGLQPRPFPGDNHAVAHGWFTLTGTLQAKGPLLVNDTLASGINGFDLAPLLTQSGDWQNPVLTGAGLRGVLRSHAERLARTLVTLQAAGKADFLRRCPACDPNVRNKEQATRVPLESCDSLLRKAERSRDRIEAGDRIESLCLACRLFGSTRCGSRLIVEDAPYKSTSRQRKPVYKILDFLAIDRFTGGGADRLKFDGLALWQPAFDLRVHLENPEPWELGWMFLVVRDLTEGWLRIGFGGAKGFGQAKLTDWRATFGYLQPEDMPNLAQRNLPEQKSGVYTTVQVTKATEGWSNVAKAEYIRAFDDQIKNFSRSTETKLVEDSYFDQVEKFYPLEKGGVQ